MTDFILNGTFVSGVVVDSNGNYSATISQGAKAPFGETLNGITIVTSYTQNILGASARYWKVVINSFNSLTILNYDATATFNPGVRLIGSSVYDSSHLIGNAGGVLTFKFDFIFSVGIPITDPQLWDEYTIDYSQGINLASSITPVIVATGHTGPVGVPARRLIQRQDGQGPNGHARLNHIGASNSGSESTGIRLKGSNTYV